MPQSINLLCAKFNCPTGWRAPALKNRSLRRSAITHGGCNTSRFRVRLSIIQSPVRERRARSSATNQEIVPLCPSIANVCSNASFNYARVATSADPDSTTYPSSAGQLELGRLLVGELQSMVWSTRGRCTWFGVGFSARQYARCAYDLLNAHMDTSPEAPGGNVQPQVIKNYAGGDIALGDSGQTIRVQDCPALNELVGHTSSQRLSGSTLLGVMDKAGIAAIMETSRALAGESAIPHGPVQLLFTCDEEIGKVLPRSMSTNLRHRRLYARRQRGRGVGGENFSADQLVIKAIGTTSTSIGKGRMINALRGLSQW